MKASENGAMSSTAHARNLIIAPVCINICKISAIEMNSMNFEGWKEDNFEI